MNETPTMYCSSRLVATYGGEGLMGKGGLIEDTMNQQWEKANFNQEKFQQAVAVINQQARKREEKVQFIPNQSMKKRTIQVFIADPDTRIPVDKSLLYHGEEKMTDLTDQELFYEIEIKAVLDKHNEYRKTVVDKQASARAGKDIFLEPIKIRDLAMNVVTIATF